MNKKKKVSKNEVTRDFYKKTFKVKDPEHFNSFEFMESSLSILLLIFFISLFVKNWRRKEYPFS